MSRSEEKSSISSASRLQSLSLLDFTLNTGIIIFDVRLEVIGGRLLLLVLCAGVFCLSLPRLDVEDNIGRRFATDEYDGRSGDGERFGGLGDDVVDEISESD